MDNLSVFMLYLAINFIHYCSSLYLGKLGVMLDEQLLDEKKDFESIFQQLISENSGLHIDLVRQNLAIADSFYITRAMHQFNKSNVDLVISITSRRCPINTIASMSSIFSIPVISTITPKDPTLSINDSLILYMPPSYVNAVTDIIKEKKWNRIFYVYETNDGLFRYESIVEKLNELKWRIDIFLHRVTSSDDCYYTILNIVNVDKNDFYVIMDTQYALTDQVINKMRPHSFILKRLHFILLNVRMSYMENLSGILSATALVLDADGADIQSTNVTYKGAFVVDAVVLFRNAANTRKKDNTIPDDNLRNETITRKTLFETLKSELMNGLSGRVQFDQSGQRDNYTFYIYESSIMHQVMMTGDWNPLRSVNMKMYKVPLLIDNTPHGLGTEMRKTVVSIVEEPFLMFKPEYKYLDTNDVRNGLCGKQFFEGYCVDVAEAVANKLRYEYDICLVEDNEFGKELQDGTWNGMIGELIKRKHDMAVAPITISSERQKVVDFTKPFMDIGISIMIQKPGDAPYSVFSFMDPLSHEIWICVVGVGFCVSVVLFFVTKFSAHEWHIDDSSLINDFSIFNSLWYTLGSFMQQGSDISPKTVSGRLVGCVWWFFTLIIISSYTANLAAFLTAQRMQSPIKSADDLAKQTKVKYGCKAGGSTQSFFQTTKVELYERMNAYMTSVDGLFTSSNEEGIKRVRSSPDYAFLIESSSNDYHNMRKPCNTMRVGQNLDSTGYGIATHAMSPLRANLTLAVLELAEDGELENLRNKWWSERNECEDNSDQEDDRAALHLTNVAGIFFILIGGLSVSIVLACIEFLHKSKADSRKRKKTFGCMIRSNANLSFRGSSSTDPRGSISNSELHMRPSIKEYSEFVYDTDRTCMTLSRQSDV